MDVSARMLTGIDGPWSATTAVTQRGRRARARVASGRGARRRTVVVLPPMTGRTAPLRSHGQPQVPSRPCRLRIHRRAGRPSADRLEVSGGAEGLRTVSLRRCEGGSGSTSVSTRRLDMQGVRRLRPTGFAATRRVLSTRRTSMGRSSCRRVRHGGGSSRSVVRKKSTGARRAGGTLLRGR
jgi:hypothetical protein